MLADVLRGYAAATLESARHAGESEALQRDLEAFAAALVQSEPLRRALVDSSVTPIARRSVVADLLEGRATPATNALIGFAVRVVAPAEFPLALGELAAFAAAPELDEPASGLRASHERLGGYAERVLEELASTEEVDEMEDAFFRLARVLEQSFELRSVLADPLAPVAARVAILNDLLAEKTSPQTLRIVAYVLRSGRVRNLVGTLEWLVEMCAAERGRRVAEVRSAIELDEAERARLATALGRLTGREVEVRVLADTSVIGGVLISIGDLVIDGTVRLRVERLRDALAESV